MTAKTKTAKAVRKTVRLDPTGLAVGKPFYLIHRAPEHGGAHHVAQPSPGVLNLSREECPVGWLGSSYGVSETALGRWVPVEIGTDENAITGRVAVKLERTTDWPGADEPVYCEATRCTAPAVDADYRADLCDRHLDSARRADAAYAAEQAADAAWDDLYR